MGTLRRDVTCVAESAGSFDGHDKSLESCGRRGVLQSRSALGRADAETHAATARPGQLGTRSARVAQRRAHGVEGRGAHPDTLEQRMIFV
jgi:hypothetical protein